MFTETANAISRFFYQRSLGILLLRVATGVIFFTHGWMKVNNMAQTIVGFSHMGFAPWVAYFIAYLEVIGGAALILGIATRFFATAFGIEMLVCDPYGGLWPRSRTRILSTDGLLRARAYRYAAVCRSTRWSAMTAGGLKCAGGASCTIEASLSRCYSQREHICLAVC